MSGSITSCLDKHVWQVPPHIWHILLNLAGSALLKFVHFKELSSFLSKSVVIFVVVILKMTTHFERNEGHATVFSRTLVDQL